MIRALLAAVLVAALGWSAYWWVGARALDRSVEAWLADRRAEGWVADASDTKVRGFPNRFDLTLTDLELADPETGLAWSAPFFQILALSYRPTHLIAVWPPEHTVATPFERVAISAADLRASLRVQDTATLALEDATFVADDVRLRSDAGWQAAIGTGRLAMRRVQATETRYELGVELLDLAPGDVATDRLDPSGTLPAEIGTLRLDAVADFTAPWNRAAIEVARPQPTAIELRELRAAWGRLDLRAAGELDVGPQGVLDGRITARAENWREILDLAVASGALPASLAPTIERGLGFLARQSGSPDTLDAALTFEDGRVAYGIIPLGAAPRLVLP